MAAKDVFQATCRAVARHSTARSGGAVHPEGSTLVKRKPCLSGTRGNTWNKFVQQILQMLKQSYFQHLSVSVLVWSKTLQDALWSLRPLTKQLWSRIIKARKFAHLRCCWESWSRGGEQWRAPHSRQDRCSVLCWKQSHWSSLVEFLWFVPRLSCKHQLVVEIHAKCVATASCCACTPTWHNAADQAYPRWREVGKVEKVGKVGKVGEAGEARCTHCTTLQYRQTVLHWPSDTELDAVLSRGLNGSLADISYESYQMN